MTADERATLAKVAELLAEQHKLEVRGHVTGDADDSLTLEALIALRGLLAEPQVNPSEAKDLLRVVKLAADALERDGVAPGVQNYLLNAHATFGPGLLAEGEESRDP